MLRVKNFLMIRVWVEGGTLLHHLNGDGKTMSGVKNKIIFLYGIYA